MIFGDWDITCDVPTLTNPILVSGPKPSYFSETFFPVAAIDKHISELLFDHDCVIVPALGGFLASNQASRVNLPKQIIYPPYRRIAFNVYLKQNDGLLANHIVKTDNIPYNVALQQIEEFSTGCLETLDGGRKVNLVDIGTLYYDKEKNIQFDATRNSNHRKDSFGMEALHFQTVERDVTTKKKTIVKPIRPSIPAVKKDGPRFNISKSKRYLGAIIVGAALVWFSLNLYLVAPKNYDSSSLNPFDSDRIVISKIDSLRNTPVAPITGNNNSFPAETTNSASPETDGHTNKIESVAVASTEPIIEETVPEKTTPEKTIPQHEPAKEITETVPRSKNYLIAGVFSIKENAVSLVGKLQSEGFPNAQLIEANNKNYVSYDGFSNRRDALVMADSLRKKNMEGWLWRY